MAVREKIGLTVGRGLALGFSEGVWGRDGERVERAREGWRAGGMESGRDGERVERARQIGRQRNGGRETLSSNNCNNVVDRPHRIGYPHSMAGNPKKRAREAQIKRAVELGLLEPGARVIPPPTQALIPEEDTAFEARDLVALEKIAMTASPEEFARASSMYFRRLLVRGLANVPVPKTIKEIQAIADMIRKSEGMDGKGAGIGGGLVGPRMVVRGALGKVVDVGEGAPEKGGGDKGAPEKGGGDKGAPEKGGGDKGAPEKEDLPDPSSKTGDLGDTDRGTEDNASDMTQKPVELCDKPSIMDVSGVDDFEV